MTDIQASTRFTRTMATTTPKVNRAPAYELQFYGMFYNDANCLMLKGGNIGMEPMSYDLAVPDIMLRDADGTWQGDDEGILILTLEGSDPVTLTGHSTSWSTTIPASTTTTCVIMLGQRIGETFRPSMPGAVYLGGHLGGYHIRSEFDM